MSTPNKDEVQGKWEQVKGAVKDKVGEATGDRSLEAEGEMQNAEGETQETWGKFKRGVSLTFKKAKEIISVKSFAFLFLINTISANKIFNLKIGIP
jgi:uncharacterized protein YjbJ (UPF0337 family)